MMDLTTVHRAFLGFIQRAEKNTGDDSLFKTFVSTSPLIDLLSSVNNQIIFGRRGTGKTHVLKYLEELVTKKGDECAIYIDLRSIGSNTSIYNDRNRSLPERASLLINDVLENLLTCFTEIACGIIDSVPHPDQVTARLDDLQKAIGSIRVHGTIEKNATHENEAYETQGIIGKIAAVDGFSASARMGADQKLKNVESISRTGDEYLHIDFGSLRTSLDSFVSILGLKKVWLLLDEWSEIPLALQPYLADLLRRVVLPFEKCVLKIAAIEYRSNFIIKGLHGEYTGFELSADITASLNLDDFLVFDSSKEKSLSFFKNLIFKHYQATEFASPNIRNGDDLINLAFTQQNVFDEFVRAIEGVPRDALNLAATLARKCYGKKFSMQDVRSSAMDWYNTDKSSSLRGSERLGRVLNIIIDEVIGKRKARAFLFSNSVNDENIEALFDARLLHILKKNISSKDEPGMRFDVFKIDYGCYVDLINTAKEPSLLFEINNQQVQEVPEDDYRSIRSAVLRPEMLAKIPKAA